MSTIQNPVLRGFNPDPSIVRVENDYYIATSTFEWFPGVQIHHSKDLAHWNLVSRPLNRTSQLDLSGHHASCGVWAPCLSYDKGTWYLVYTDVRTDSVGIKDTHNYLVTAPSIEGPWSDPVYLHSHGFDPSLFHDSDGRKWVLVAETDYRKGKNRFAGILLQEWSPQERRLIGPSVTICKGSALGKTEGPHLYRRDGWYYLLLAEGGTGLGHAATMARSRTITGPYEIDPCGSFLSSREYPLDPLQKAGHASLIQAHTGDWYIAHLASRPIPRQGKSILGRETAIQRVIWTDDGWLRTETDGGRAALTVNAPRIQDQPWPDEPGRRYFDGPALPIEFQTLRVPLNEDTLSLTERPGFLRLKGRETVGSRHLQALVARRQQAFRFNAAAELHFLPNHFKHAAGLMCMYDHLNFYYLRITHDEALGRVADIMTAVKGTIDFPLSAPIPVPGTEPVVLSVKNNYDRLRFSLAMGGGQARDIGDVFDSGTLADENGPEGKYTGAFVALCAQDLTGGRFPADFRWFEYTEEE